MNNAKKQPIFAEGIFFDRPREGAPEFVKGKMAIHPRKFLEWAKQQAEYASEKGYLNFQLLKSKDGSKLYFTLDTYKPKKVDTSADFGYSKNEQESGKPDPMTSEGYDGEPSINAEEIPF